MPQIFWRCFRLVCLSRVNVDLWDDLGNATLAEARPGGYLWGTRRDLELSFLPHVEEKVVESCIVVIETVLDSLYVCVCVCVS